MATILKTGSSGEEVKKLQQALQEKGYDLGSFGVDGIFGAKTDAAVRAYQKDNGLSVDGIAGEKTLGSLYAAAQTPQELAPEEPPKADVPVYTPSYEGLLTSLEEKLQKGQDFSYRLEDDPLYHQYRKAYIKDGALAARDIAAKATAATGGYGNSYAESVSQQTLQDYLQKLYALTPELAAAAYDKHQEKQADLLAYYKAVQAAKEAEYDRYQDALKQYKDQQEAAYEKQQDKYKTLQTLVKAGYDPSDEELNAVGMTRAQAQALKPKATASGSSGAGYDNGIYSESQIMQLQTFLGVTPDGKFGAKSKAAMKEAGYTSLKKAMEAMENQVGYFDYDDTLHSQLNDKNNGQSMYSMVLRRLKEMHAQSEPLEKVASYLKQMVGASYITQSEYLRLYNRYRDHNLSGL